MQVIINVQMRNISNCMSLIIVPRHLRDDDDDDLQGRVLGDWPLVQDE